MDIKVLRSQTVYSISCLECRRRKIKCDKLSPACEFCLNKKIQCEYPSNAKRKVLNVDHTSSGGVKIDKDEVIKELLQRCATLEDYLKADIDKKLPKMVESLQTKASINSNVNSNLRSKDFLEIVDDIDARLSEIAKDTTLMDELTLSKREFPIILQGKEQDEVLLKNIIRTVSANFKAFSFFLTEEDVDLFYQNFKQETLEPVHFQDSLIMLLLLSICIRLKKFTCACIPVDKKEELVQEIFNEYKHRCDLKLLSKDFKTLQIGLLEMEFMFGMDKHKEDILIGIHEVIGVGKFIRYRDQAKKLGSDFESCWLELQRMDCILAIAFGTSPGISEPVKEDLSIYAKDERRYQSAPIFINTIKILQKYSYFGVDELNSQDILFQINNILQQKDLFYLLDLVTLYHIQLQLLFKKGDYTGYTQVLESCLVEIWKVSLTDDSHIARIKWVLQLIFNNLLEFVLHYREVNSELTISLSIIICLNNLFSIDNHDPNYISNKLERYCAKLNLEYCFDLLTRYEKENPQIFGTPKYCGDH